jgi:hypothetical protein
VLRLLVTANAVPSSPITVTLMMGAILSSETSALTRATRCHIHEDVILAVLRFDLRAYRPTIILDTRVHVGELCKKAVK